MGEINLKPYHIGVINNIPTYSSVTSKRGIRKIKEIMREHEYDDDYAENISDDFCEGWNTARSIIANMLSDRYWELNHQITEGKEQERTVFKRGRN